MVRFHWHVEDGLAAFVPPNGLVQHKDTAVMHATCELEMPGQGVTIPSCMTLPPHYLQETAVKEVGVVLAHDLDATDWQGRLLTEVAVQLAKQGYIVMRYSCKQKEFRRLKVFEKALDACATSPFARNVERWVLAGIGNGARIAATVGGRCRGTMAGFVFMSYPLMDPLPAYKGPAAPDSIAPLTRLKAPMLFISSTNDPLCRIDDLKRLAPELESYDVRLLHLQDVDASFKTLAGKGPMANTMKQICNAILEFVGAVHVERLDKCKLPRIKASQQPTGTYAALNYQQFDGSGNDYEGDVPGPIVAPTNAKRERTKNTKQLREFKPMPGQPPDPVPMDTPPVQGAGEIQVLQTQRAVRKRTTPAKFEGSEIDLPGSSGRRSGGRAESNARSSFNPGSAGYDSSVPPRSTSRTFDSSRFGEPPLSRACTSTDLDYLPFKPELLSQRLGRRPAPSSPPAEYDYDQPESKRPRLQSFEPLLVPDRPVKEIAAPWDNDEYDEGDLIGGNGGGADEEDLMAGGMSMFLGPEAAGASKFTF